MTMTESKHANNEIAPATSTSSSSGSSPAGTIPSSPATANPSPAKSSQTASSPKKKEDRKVIWGVAFIALVVVAFVIWLFATGKAGSFFDALLKADLWWVAAGATFYIAFFMLDVFCYRVAGMLTGARMGFLDLLSVGAAGIVFGYLTPGQTGAAPAQIVRLSQVGLKVGDATAVQLTKFFIYQAAVTVFGAVVLIAKSSYFVERFGDIVLVSVLSFLVHLGIMAALIAVIFFPNVVRKVCHVLVRLASGRIHLIKDPDAARARINEEVDEYTGAVHHAIRHGGVVGTAVVVTLLQLGCLYCVPYCVIRAFGVDHMDFATSVCAAAFVQLIMTAVPLPGGTGGAEAGFALFFGPELGTFTTAAVALWRFLTFYLPIVVCAPMLGLRSRLTPAERLEEFGEAHVGYEGVRDTMKIMRQRTVELRDAAGQRLGLRRLKSGRRAYIVLRGSLMTPDRRAWYRAHRLRRRHGLQRHAGHIKLADLKATRAVQKMAPEASSEAVQDSQQPTHDSHHEA